MEPTTTQKETTFKVDAAEIRAALERAVVEKKTTIPTLLNVMLKPTDEGLQVISTDLDMSVITEVDATVGKGSEAVLLPHKVALDVLKGEDDALSITDIATTHTSMRREQGQMVNGVFQEGEEKEHKITHHWSVLKIGETVYKIPTGDPEIYPTVPAVTGRSITLTGSDLKSMIDRASFAISKEESRYTLHGALFQVESGQLTVVATDGHRLALERKQVSSRRKTKPVQAIVPLSALVWLTRHVGKSEEVEVSIGAETVSFALPDLRTTLITKKLNGQFPNYEAVMPRRDAVKMTATFPAADALSRSLTRVAKMADERSGAVRFAVNGSFVMSAQSTETGEAEATVAANITHTEGAPDEINIGLHSEYVLDFLKVVGKNPVSLLLRDGESAALMESPAIPDYSYVLMPMRI